MTLAILGFASASASAVACGEEPATPEALAPAQTVPSVVFLSPTGHLARASMALRGIRPSTRELEEVAADPNKLPVIVDRYLVSEEFGATIRELHDEGLKVKIAPVMFPAGFAARGPLARMEAQQLNDAITDAPLRLVEHVVKNDRPYTEIVTADYTLANGAVAAVWGLPYEGDGDEWRSTHYADGREHAGILSDSFLFTRHSTTYSNANRGRANAISSALLCYDFLQRDITIDATINLADPDEVANATKKNAACASCHQTLDPLASYFASFRPQYVPAFEQSYPVVFNTSALAKVFSSAEPAYFGHEGRGLRFLGAQIAEDPRFSLCAAKRFYSYLNQVPLERVPIERAAELQRVFVDSKMNAKQLARAVVLSDDFRSAYPTKEDVEGTAPGMRKVRARELARLVRDLTGLEWQTEIGQLAPGSAYDTGIVGRIDLVTDPFFGYSVLFGGTDAYYVTRPSHSMNATASAVLRAVAAKAAAKVVEADLAEPVPERRRLLLHARANGMEEPAVRAQLVDLHARVFGEIVPPTSADVDATYALFADALATAGGDAKRAWTVTLYALLQDVRFVFY